MEISVGQPPEEGRYVVFTPCAALGARHYCEPSIATYQGGRWHTFNPPWGWIGPLPVVHGDELAAKSRAHFEPQPEYDL